MKNIGDINVAFLRGINIGSYHKIAMPDLIQVLKDNAIAVMTTVLNSGNIIFRSADKNTQKIEEKIEAILGTRYQFPVPTIIKTKGQIEAIASARIFTTMTKDRSIKHYITFTKAEQQPGIGFPFTTADGAFKIWAYQDKVIFSSLDLSRTQTTKGMEILADIFGKNITTRNLDTIDRIVAKIRTA